MEQSTQSGTETHSTMTFRRGAPDTFTGVNAVVSGVVQETADTRSLILDACGQDLSYEAGQYVTLELPFERGALRRCYSFSSSPETDSRPAITVKRVPGGQVSNWLHDHVRIGSVLHVRRPSGHFTLDLTAQGSLLLMGAGSGITPLMSLLKTALTRTSRRIRLLYANRTLDATVFRGQLDLLAAAQRDRFEMINHYDDEHGVPNEATIASALRSFDHGDIYLCGPGPFTQLVERCVKVAAPTASLHVERFSASAAAPAHEQVVGGVGARVLWRVGAQTFTFSCATGETVLEAARRAGHDPPASCEQGYCGACAAKLQHGRVNMLASEGLSRSKRALNWILPCQSHALTDELTLET